MHRIIRLVVKSNLVLLLLIPAVSAAQDQEPQLHPLAGEEERVPPGLKFVYRVRFAYPDGWEIPLSGSQGTESQHFFLAEGRVEGALQGRMRGANHPRRRTDGTFVPDFQGIIETDDGSTLYFDWMGYGRAYPAGRRQIVVSATHLSNAGQYSRFNDSVFVGIGEVRSGPGEPTELVIDFYELLWVPIPE